MINDLFFNDVDLSLEVQEPTARVSFQESWSIEKGY